MFSHEATPKHQTKTISHPQNNLRMRMKEPDMNILVIRTTAKKKLVSLDFPMYRVSLYTICIMKLKLFKNKNLRTPYSLLLCVSFLFI